MANGHPIAWSAREQRLIDAAIRALLAGKHPTVKSAARACFAQLTQLRRQHPDAQSPLASKTLDSTYYDIRNRVRGKWEYARQVRWTAGEIRVLKRYVQPLLRGRYLSAAEAGRACFRKLRRLRRSDRNSGWSSVPHAEGAVCAKMAKLARKAGRSQWRVRYTKAEISVFERYARAMAAGRYPNLTPAVVLCRRDLARMRARSGQSAPPPRPFEPVRRQICRRARSLGWSWNANPGRLVSRRRDIRTTAT